MLVENVFKILEMFFEHIFKYSFQTHTHIKTKKKIQINLIKRHEKTLSQNKDMGTALFTRIIAALLHRVLVVHGFDQVVDRHHCRLGVLEQGADFAVGTVGLELNAVGVL